MKRSREQAPSDKRSLTAKRCSSASATHHVLLITLWITGLCGAALAQGRQMDSLQALLSNDPPPCAKAALQYSIGSRCTRQGEYRKALEFQLLAFHHYEDHHPDSAAIASASLTDIYYYLGAYDYSLEHAFHAIDYYENTPEKEPLVRVLNRVGLLYSRLEDHEKALEYLNKALGVAVENRLTQPGHCVRSNISCVYYDQEKYEESLRLDLESLRYHRERGDSSSVAAMLNNIGANYAKQQQWSAALRYYRKAEKARQNPGLGEKAIVAGNVGQAYAALNDPRAYPLLRESIALARQCGDRQTLARNYQRMAAYMFEAQRYGEAYEYLEHYMKVNDSIFSEASDNRIANLQVVYETRKKEEALKLSQTQVRLLHAEAAIREGRNRWLIRFSSALVVILIMLGLMVWQKIRASRQQKLIHEQEKAVDRLKIYKQEAENTRLKMEIDHKNRELSSVTMHIFNKNEMLTTIQEHLRKLRENPSETSQIIRAVCQSVQQNLNLDSNWKAFQFHFEEVHPGFFETLKDRYPELSETDLRHCAYIRMNLTTKEIARLMNITPSSVQMARVRLKKKLRLDRTHNLQLFIASV